MAFCFPLFDRHPVADAAVGVAEDEVIDRDALDLSGRDLQRADERALVHLLPVGASVQDVPEMPVLFGKRERSA